MGSRPPGKVDLLVLLGEAREVGVDSQGLENLFRGRYLAGPPVDEHEVRQVQALVDEARIASGDRLAHGAEIVDRSLEAPDLEVAVVLLVGHAVLEGDEGGDGVLARELRDIEALDQAWKRGEAELLPELL